MLNRLLATQHAQAFEDEDFLDPDTDTRLTKLMSKRTKPAEPAGAPSMPSEDVGAGAAGAGPQQPPAGAPHAAKRPRSPEGGAAGAAGGAAAPAAAAPPAKVARVLDQEAAAQLAAIEADCGITLAQLTEALTPPLSMTVRGDAGLRLQSVYSLLTYHVC